MNSTINSLPFELHLPGYQVCGPGTKLRKRLARGDRGITDLDTACMKHDIAYHKSKVIKDRHVADLALQLAAERRGREGGFLERIAAKGVAAAMHVKRKFGMGLGGKKRKVGGVQKK